MKKKIDLFLKNNNLITVKGITTSQSADFRRNGKLEI